MIMDCVQIDDTVVVPSLTRPIRTELFHKLNSNQNSRFIDRMQTLVWRFRTESQLLWVRASELELLS